MKKGLICILFFLFFINNIIAQTSYSSLAKSWHQRKPYAGYWQQDVAYSINAFIDEENKLIDATETLVYTNNSPHDLPFVYFHLYQNAFVDGSYLCDLHKANKVDPYFAPNSKLGQGLGEEVFNVSVNGVECKTELDNTVLKVYLPQPIKSGGKVTFSMKFKTYWETNTMRRRMQLYNAWGFSHFNGVHWYPRICVYDKKKGWDTDQHLNKELYGDFGTFDVTLNFPDNYIVEATGALQNKNEVLPPALLEQLQISNFANKPWNEKPSTIIPYTKGQRKIWKYHAEHVHDFAFTGDPSYRIAQKDTMGVECIALVQEPHASKWQNAADYVAKIIGTFSNDFGMYEYPKMVAADANDGMEYPMLTLDGGGDPDYRGLLVHEIGHNWFYGMIGNNETYRAALDEGFTQFITAWGLQKIDGDTMVSSPEKSLRARKYRKPALVWDRSFLNRYTNDALRGDDKALNTHSNGFNGALAHENGYGNVYHKTATMLLNLQYVLGDSLFLKSMQHYVTQWKFAHPYFEDFRNSIIEFTHVDLNWFFDQWLETTKSINYEVEKVSKTELEDFKIKLRRKGEMTMPIDITVVAKKGEKYSYHIPNDKWFVKSTTAKVLPHWYGMDILNPTYTFTAHVPSGIKYVQIDTTFRLADVDMTDNYGTRLLSLKKYNKEKLYDHGIRNVLSRRKITVVGRGDLKWTGIDGFKPGIRIESSYLNYLHKIEAGVWMNTRILNNNVLKEAFDYSNIMPIDYSFNYESPIIKMNRKLIGGLHFRSVEGFSKNAAYASWNFNANNNIKLEVASIYRYLGAQYQNYRTEWSSFQPKPFSNSLLSSTNQSNNFAQLSYTHFKKRFNGNGQFNLIGRTNLPSWRNTSNHFNYAYLQGEWLEKFGYKKFDISTRLFARLGAGSQIPTESALYLSGANNEEMADVRYARTRYSWIPNVSTISANNFAYLQQGGGLNLRGYAGYLAVDADNSGNTYINYKGLSGASANIEVDFDKYINWRPKLLRRWLKADAYLFADGGIISRATYNVTDVYKLTPLSQLSLSKLRADAGLGTMITVKSWGAYEKARPLSVRIDFPLYISSVPFSYPYSNFSLRRMVVGINRCF
jgi:hypothetical protein